MIYYYLYESIKEVFPVSVVSYKCPNCGGELHFDPESQQLKCDYCLSLFEESALEKLTKQHTYDTPGREIIEDASDEIGHKIPKGGANLYTCPSCGAEIVTEPNTSATKCWYCHSPLVFSKQLTDEFRPSKVIPFQISKDQALEAFKSWCHSKKFLPDDFTSPRQLDNISGVYVPYWLVDCDTHGYLRGTGKQLQSWTSGEYRYTKTDVYSISRAADMSFSYLPHDASKKAEDKVMESIAPFNYDTLTDFSYAYLSGFIADKYDVTKEDVYPLIKKRIESAVTAELRSSVRGYTSTSYAGQNVQINKTKFHYTLMPIWMLTYNYAGTVYLFAMNGQTGKTFGSVPISTSKLNRFTVFLCIILFAVSLLIILYLGGIQL